MEALSELAIGFGLAFIIDLIIQRTGWEQSDEYCD